ncbi:MAG TPA: GNAT family N-acetyltransferase, partial [bacterium]
MSNLVIRPAAEIDVPVILSFIKKLAEYERLSHEVVATEESLRTTLFGEKPYAEVVIGYYRNQPVAFALFFHNYSTFLGRPGIYLEDLFVLPEMRGKG